MDVLVEKSRLGHTCSTQVVSHEHLLPKLLLNPDVGLGCQFVGLVLFLVRWESRDEEVSSGVDNSDGSLQLLKTVCDDVGCGPQGDVIGATNDDDVRSWADDVWMTGDAMTKTIDGDAWIDEHRSDVGAGWVSGTTELQPA